MNQSDVKVYDDRAINIDTYTYVRQASVPTSDLKLNTYNGVWQGGVEAGFTYNMPFVEHSYQCVTAKTVLQSQMYRFKFKDSPINGRPTMEPFTYQ